MKKFLLSLCLSILACGYTWAQFTGQYNALNITGSQNTLRTSIPLAEPGIVGSTYVDEKWQPAEIVLKDGKRVPDLLIRIEIEQGNVEIAYDEQVRYLNLKGVDSLKLGSGTSRNAPLVRLASGYTTSEGTPPKGIMILYPGAKYCLAKNYYIEFQPSNYNVAMDVGSRDNRKLKKEQLYLLSGDVLINVSGSNKKIASKLGSDASNVLAMAKERNLKLSREADLLTLVKWLK
jgi:hypothetical protein